MAQLMIHKGAKPAEVREGYRPITITQAAYRLLALVVLNRLEEESHHYIKMTQGGCIKRRGTMHPLTVVTLTMQRLLQSEAKLAVLLMDQKQA